jgi:hypothetical protein
MCICASVRVCVCACEGISYNYWFLHPYTAPFLSMCRMTPDMSYIDELVDNADMNKPYYRA